MKSIIITGASSGIGKETAKLFALKGFKVFATARNVQAMADLKELGCILIKLDVTDDESIQKAFKQIYESTSVVDILINNAGFSQNGFLEELSRDQLLHQFEVNVFGLLRVTQQVLPQMRSSGSGLIINVGSMGGDFTTPGASAYHASKYALESFTDGLRQELKGFGIKVSLIKPGGVATNFINNAAFPLPVKGNPYGLMRENYQKMLLTVLDPSKSSFGILKPEEVALKIYKTAISKKPATRVRIGASAKFIPFVKWLISDNTFDTMIIKQLGLNNVIKTN